MAEGRGDEKRVGASLSDEYWEKWQQLMGHWRWNQRTSLEFMIDHFHRDLIEKPADQERA